MRNRIVILLTIISGLILIVKPDISYCQSTDEVKVETINLEKLDRIISNRNGKPLLINVWATWCVPCLEEFPDLIEFSKKYKNEIEVVGISVDLPEEIDSKVIPFLQKHNAGFPNFIADIKDPEDFINLLNTDWSGAIPATFFYDKNCEQLNYHTGKNDLEGFEKMISPVIN